MISSPSTSTSVPAAGPEVTVNVHVGVMLPSLNPPTRDSRAPASEHAAGAYQAPCRVAAAKPARAYAVVRLVTASPQRTIAVCFVGKSRTDGSGPRTSPDGARRRAGSRGVGGS